VLVIDEFAALAKEVPEFVDGVVDIAQRGRSLGIHLIMATQRPAGVIKDNLRANTNLRVALRMADETDSDDVIGSKEAALFDPGIPGRGIAKTGPGRMNLFQSAYSGGWSLRAEAEPAVEVRPFLLGDAPAWEKPAVEAPAETEDLGPNDQQLLVARFGDAARWPASRRPAGRGSTSWPPRSTRPSCTSAPTRGWCSASWTCPSGRTRCRSSSNPTPRATSRSSAPAARESP
jgi:S-DNA-T family DNA segregation ATPase FtsK/SpoIIIE